MFSNTLKELRKEKGWTQEKLAEILGIAKSTISMYENGNREPDFEMLEAFADIFNVDMNYLINKSKFKNTSSFPNWTVTEPLPDNIIPVPKTKKIPLLGTIACGMPILAVENIEEYIDIESEVKADFCLRCKGDSMINARIFNGDYVFIRQQSDVENGEIAAVLIDGEATLKRVYHYENRIELRAENPTFPPLSYEGEKLSEIRILGKAVYFLSKI